MTKRDWYSMTKVPNESELSSNDSDSDTEDIITELCDDEFLSSSGPDETIDDR